MKQPKGLILENYQKYFASLKVGKMLMIFMFIFLGHNEKVFAFEKLSRQNTVTGTVTDSNGIPFPGVNVIEKGTANGMDGNGELAVLSWDRRNLRI